MFRFPELGDALERLAAEGAEPFYRGEVGDRDRRTGSSSAAGRSARPTWPPTQPIAPRAGQRPFRGREVLTNPPPSSGGILIAYALELLERDRRACRRDRRGIVAAMEAAQVRRATEEFLDRALRVADGLRGERLPRGGDRLGSTTHITAVDGDGRCASVTCSNGTGSGLIVPGTGVHVNNMLGEEDLNPLGFHRLPAGPADAVDDVADRGAARRASSRSGSAAAARTGSARRSCRRSCG